MAFTLKIETGNAAFGDADSSEYYSERAEEVGRILRELASELLSERSPRDGEQGILRDHNGNTVGDWAFMTD
jgi:hypothetical protein